MEDKPETFETKPIARSNEAGSFERTEQDNDLAESSVQVFEEAAIQIITLSSALLGAFLGLTMFSAVPASVPDEARLIVGIAFGFLFLAMLFALAVILPGSSVSSPSRPDAGLRLQKSVRRKYRFGRLASWSFVIATFFMLIAILILLVA